MNFTLADYIEEFMSSDQIKLPEGLSWEKAASALASFCCGIRVGVNTSLGLQEMEKSLSSAFQSVGGTLELKRGIPVLIESYFNYLSHSGIFPPASGWIEDLHLASSRCISRVREDGTVKGETFRKNYTDVGRNDDCPCGSGRKFKKCCMKLIS